MSRALQTSIFVALVVAGAATAARAADPKFEYKPIETVKKVEWKVSAQAGLVLNTGNANTLAFSASGFASRNDGKNKLTLDVGGTYARARRSSARAMRTATAASAPTRSRGPSRPPPSCGTSGCAMTDFCLRIIRST
jgi:hypothetical protein